MRTHTSLTSVPVPGQSKHWQLTAQNCTEPWVTGTNSPSERRWAASENENCSVRRELINWKQGLGGPFFVQLCILTASACQYLELNFEKVYILDMSIPSTEPLNHAPHENLLRWGLGLDLMCPDFGVWVQACHSAQLCFAKCDDGE